MRNLKTFLLLGLFCVTSMSAAVTITNFGTGAEADGWTWDQGTSILSGTEGPGALLFSSVEPLNLNLSGNNAVSITANVTTAPTLGFTFLLYDNVNKTASAQFDWADFSGGATVISILTNVDAGFNFSSVSNWNLVSGSSNAAISAVLTSAIAVSVVPEPSTYAALFGLAALGFCSVRRRRKV